MIRNRSRSVSLALALAAAMVACDRELGEGPILGVVYGMVTRASGDPVPGATVTLWGMDRATCSNAAHIPTDSSITGAAGDFRIESWSFGGARGPFSYAVCARLTVRFRTDPALRDTTLNGIEYRMYFGPPDSTRIDIRLAQ